MKPHKQQIRSDMLHKRMKSPIKIKPDLEQYVPSSTVRDDCEVFRRNTPQQFKAFHQPATENAFNSTRVPAIACGHGYNKFRDGECSMVFS